MTITKHFVNSNGALLIFVIVWGMLVYLYLTKLNTSLLVERESEALKQLDKNDQKKYELKKIIKNFLNDFDNIQQISSQKKIIENFKYQLKQFKNTLNDKILQNSQKIVIKPLSEYEELRRRVRQNTQKMWDYFNSELEIIREYFIFKKEITDHINSVLQLGAEHKRSLISDIDEMRSVDGYELWRHQEATDLSNLVQRRLSNLQNPIDCKNANKLICKIDSECGYGCGLHLLVYCFIRAYGTERTMILNSTKWIYQKPAWKEVFQPVSKTCTEYEIIGYRNKIANKPFHTPCLPLYIPEDLAARLIKFHGDPSVWWIGQILKYILKPKYETQKMLEIGIKKLGWKKPIVGIHIRRTDKINTEASFYTIDEYMTNVEDYYLTLDINSTKKIERRVYIASDDPSVITDARIKYPQYKIIGDPNLAKRADLSTRYSLLNDIILAVHLLSLSDYLVCTFSSNVCRLAYEIMQTYYPDAYDRFKTLDSAYFYCIPNNTHKQVVLIPHEPRYRNEIYLEVGDIISCIIHLWNGFSNGTNTRTNEYGLFPSFKVKDKVETFNNEYFFN